MVDERERAYLKVHQPARQRFLIYSRLCNKTPRHSRGSSVLDGFPLIGRFNSAEMFGALANDINSPAGH